MKTELARRKNCFRRPNGYADLRELLKDDAVDAVVVATCNHWHCLAAIWAMEAGKDVYVEKPLSHTQWEGRQTVAAARKYDRICQIGTQQRSDPMQAQIKAFLHGEKALGEIKSARVNRYGVRATIGKRDTPLEIEKNVNYDLWLGPAQDEPLFRDKLHYDWHWDWNTGSGEMGNWGVHVLDDLRNNVFQDKVTLPSRICGGGGRVAWNDAGETPNVHFVYFDTGSIPTVIGLSNLTAGPGQRGGAPHPGPGSGYIAYCEGGRLEGQRGRAVAFDADGKKVKEFSGTSGMGIHQQNFIDAVRSRDRSSLNAEVAVGHDSTGWCNLANIAFQAGTAFVARNAKKPSPILKASGRCFRNGSPSGGPFRQFGRFGNCAQPHAASRRRQRNVCGSPADAANQLLKRQYRSGYEVPELI
ncbi:MAG: Gfo/Idh/MocA family oxidoreductase [Pirellulaceae bacterium]